MYLLKRVSRAGIAFDFNVHTLLVDGLYDKLGVPPSLATFLRQECRNSSDAAKVMKIQTTFFYSFFFCLQLFGYQLEIRKKK